MVYKKFKVEETELSVYFDKWKSSLWFAPGEYDQLPFRHLHVRISTTKLSSVKKIYVPHYLFDVHCNIVNTAKKAEETKEKVPL